MSMLRWLTVLLLVFGLQNSAAAALPIVEPRLAPRDAVAEPPAAVVGAPDETVKLFLPQVSRRYASGYDSPFGIVMYTAINDAAGQAKMRAAGTHWYTTGLIWASVEPNPPAGDNHTYQWGSLDTDAYNVSVYGGETYVLVTGNPAWAATYPGGPVNINNTGDLVAFAAAAAERYDGDGVSDAPGHPVINYWSFYAEPDNGAEWAALQGKGYWGHNPGGYAAMLMQVAPAVHAANPNAKVLIGGIAYDSFESDGGIFVKGFLGEVLNALGNEHADNYIDAVAFHYYPINLNRWPSIREKGLEIRDIMNAHGVGHLELLVPEMGYWSAIENGSSEQRQAEVLVQMYVKGLSIGLSHMDWFAPFDDGTGMEAHGLFHGTNPNDPKLAYTAYAVLAETLLAMHYNRTFGISGGEGYVFRGTDNHEVTVAWATGASATAFYPGNCVRLTDLYGAVSVLGGVSQVAVPLSQDQPVYLTAC